MALASSTETCFLTWAASSFTAARALFFLDAGLREVWGEGDRDEDREEELEEEE
jgi:hypothetical protein